VQVPQFFIAAMQKQNFNHNDEKQPPRGGQTGEAQ